MLLFVFLVLFVWYWMFSGKKALKSTKRKLRKPDRIPANLSRGVTSGLQQRNYSLASSLCASPHPPPWCQNRWGSWCNSDLQWHLIQMWIYGIVVSFPWETEQVLDQTIKSKRCKRRLKQTLDKESTKRASSRRVTVQPVPTSMCWCVAPRVALAHDLTRGVERENF